MRVYENLKLVEKFAQNVINDVIKKLDAEQKAPTIITKGNYVGMIAASTIAIKNEKVPEGKISLLIESVLHKNWKYLKKGIFAPDFYELDYTNADNRRYKSLMLPTSECGYVKHSLDIYPEVDDDLKDKESERYNLVVSVTSICNNTQFLEDADSFRLALAIRLEIGRL